MESVAATSGRNMSQVRVDWVRSIGSMADDEMNSLLESHYPEATKVKQQREQHESATGHSVRLHGAWALYGDPDPDEPR